MLDFISANTFQAGSLDRGLDQKLVRLIQIEHAAGLEIGLLAEAHHDETSAYFLRRIVAWRRSRGVITHLVTCLRNSKQIGIGRGNTFFGGLRSEEHTSELQ